MAIDVILVVSIQKTSMCLLYRGLCHFWLCYLLNLNARFFNGYLPFFYLTSDKVYILALESFATFLILPLISHICLEGIAPSKCINSNTDYLAPRYEWFLDLHQRIGGLH